MGKVSKVYLTLLLQKWEKLPDMKLARKNMPRHCMVMRVMKPLSELGT